MEVADEIIVLCLPASQIAANFEDPYPRVTPTQAVAKTIHFGFCYNAPYIEVRPIGIDVPRFIRGIATGTPAGAAAVPHFMHWDNLNDRPIAAIDQTLCIDYNLYAHVYAVDACITMVDVRNWRPYRTRKDSPYNPSSANFVHG